MIWVILPTLVLVGLMIYFQCSYNRIHQISRASCKFREIRYSLFFFIADNMDTMPRVDIYEYRSFLSQVDKATKNLDRNRDKWVRFKDIKSTYLAIMASEKTAGEKQPGLLEKYHDDYSDAWMTYFEAVPFFQARLFLRSVTLRFKTLIRAGLYQIKKHFFHAQRHGL